jgi:hypothetical protein
VTNGGYLPEPEKNRWQEQFVRRLRERFPKAEIELVTRRGAGATPTATGPSPGQRP